MTREEAISEWTFRSNHIKKWLDEYGEEPSIRHYVELIDMAIEALSVYTYTEQSDKGGGDAQMNPIPNGTGVMQQSRHNDGRVEVVRCKDCVWSKEWNDNQIFCDRILMRLRETDFCSYGERREK